MKWEAKALWDICGKELCEYLHMQKHTHKKMDYVCVYKYTHAYISMKNVWKALAKPTPTKRLQLSTHICTYIYTCFLHFQLRLQSAMTAKWPKDMKTARKRTSASH